MSNRYAFASLVTSDHYLPGALAVAAALKEVHPYPPSLPEVSYQTVCIVTPETIDVKTIKALRKAYDLVIGVEVIDVQNAAGLALLGRPDLHAVLTKLHVFRLTQFDKIIFLDADVLPLRPISHLFTLPYEFSAVPDVGWPDIFNSGVMVLTPGEDKFSEIMSLVKAKGSWDGGDQGVLNEWRGDDWHRLSFVYNTTPTAAYTYAPAYQRFGSQIAAVHFIGPNKPWKDLSFRAPSSSSQEPYTVGQSSEGDKTTTYAYSYLIDRWFNVYDRYYRQPATTLFEDDFEVQRFENVWDEPSPAYQTTHIPQPSISSVPFTLDELRNLNIQGGSQTATREGEGEYRSLPLEGRVDLMRPKEDVPSAPVLSEHPRVSENDPSQSQQEAWHAQQHHSDPGPSGAYSTPQATHRDLPPPSQYPPSGGDSSHGHNEKEDQDQYHEYREHHEQHQETQHEHNFEYDHVLHQDQPPVPSEQHHDQHDHHHHHEEHYMPPPMEPPRPPSPPMMKWNPAVEPPPNIPPPPSALPTTAYFTNAWDVTPASAKFQAQVTGETQQDVAAFFRPPPQSEIPKQLVSEGHYANVMGPPVHHPPSAAPSIPSEHFAPQPPQDSQHRPDISKVHSVFPWEGRPRHLPSRVFPEGESAPRAPYIEETPPPPPPAPEVSEPEPEIELEQTTSSFTESPTTTYVPIPFPGAESAEPSKQRRSMYINIPTAPPSSFPGAAGYSNIWDAVPSIQRYAQRLVKPPAIPIQAPLPRSPRASRSRRDSYLSRGEQSDANSGDGDVEDEVDDEEGEEAAGRFSSSERSDSGKGRQREREKSGSKSPPSVAARTKSGKKEYRSYGVQTVPKDVRSVAVQVSHPVIVTGKPTPASARSRPSQSQVSIPTPVVNAPTLTELPRVPSVERLYGDESMGMSTPTITNVQAFVRPPLRAAASSKTQSGALSPRLHENHGYDSPKTPSANISPSHTPTTTNAQLVKAAVAQQQQQQQLQQQQLQQLQSQGRPPVITQLQTTQAPMMFARTSSTDTYDSSIGPVSPSDYSPLASISGSVSRKPAGRIWNPATGVDVFKRGSEEVLARFLRMGSWDEDSPTAQQHQQHV